jgi:sterol desaturase/sphingolipid hydroxylase (fatty acid hydroxylase superfamily)
MHLWHHAEELPKERINGVNFGITLSIWDYIFGLNYVPKEDATIKLGFDDMAKFPKTFWSQSTYAFWKKQ